MKLLKKITALMAVASIAISCVVTASAKASTFTVTASKDTVAVGDTVTIYVEIDDYSDVAGIQISLKHEDGAFTVPEGTNAFFGGYLNINKYINYDFANDRLSGSHITKPLATLSPNYVDNELIVVLVDTSSGAVISASDNADTSKGRKMAFDLIAQTADETTITVQTKVSNPTESDLGTQTITLNKVAGPVETTAIKTNDMHGQETFASKMTFTDVANPGVVIEKGAETKKFDLPSGVVGGWTDVIAIVRYKKADVVAGDIFKVFIASNGEKVDANKYVKYEVTAADAAAEE